MTAKQKVMLVAAQYAAKARAMTLEGDRLVALSELVDEDGAKEIYSALQRLGLIDSDGLLVEGEDKELASLCKAGLS